jgi:tetratricopeptide (TPR) repeat protein
VPPAPAAGRDTRAKEPLFLALRSLPIAAYARGEHGLARDLAEQCYALAQGLHERTYVVEALQLLGSTQFLLGGYPTARQHYEQGLALYHRLAPPPPVVSAWAR